MRRRVQRLQAQICRRVTTSSAGELWSRVSGQTAPWETLLTGPSSSQGRSVIRISGKESGKFIHGLVTNDIQRLPIPSEAAAAAFLTVKGRILADVMIHVPPDAQPGTGGPDKLYVDVARDLKEPLLRHLKMYKLRSKVVIADVSDSVSLRAVVGGGLSEFKAGEGGVIAAGRDPRCEGLGVRVLVGKDEEVRRPSGLRRGNIEEYTALRLACGIPEGVDLVEKFPSECNLDLVNAVCFDKGCYLGQELTARTQFKGVVRKRLLPFISRAIPLEAPLPPAAPVAPFSSSVAAAADGYEFLMGPDVAPPAKDADVVDHASGKKVGTVSSVAAGVNVGLALLRLDNVLNRPVSLVVDSSPGHRHVIRPYLPPWWPTLDLKTGKPPA